jgi:hypothetical protein
VIWLKEPEVGGGESGREFGKDQKNETKTVLMNLDD